MLPPTAATPIAPGFGYGATPMIGRLTGKIVAEEADGALVLEVNGVGYEVFAPLGTLGRLGVSSLLNAANSAGGTSLDREKIVTLYIHTHVREEAFTLFAFASDVDRTAFRTLIGVSSVGPKTAVAILSALPGVDLARAIAEKNLGRLTSISGIGKKTAERLLLELRDKLPVASAHDGPSPIAATSPSSSKTKHSGNAELLHTALVNLGYRPVEADRAISTLGDRVATEPMATLIRESLVVLAK